MINYESLEKVLNKAGYYKRNVFTQTDGKVLTDFENRKTQLIFTSIAGPYAVESVIMTDTRNKTDVKTSVLKSLKEVFDTINNI